MGKKKSNIKKTGIRDSKPDKTDQPDNCIITFDESVDESLIKELLEKLAYLKELSG